jgi:gas vesicle protein
MSINDFRQDESGSFVAGFIIGAMVGGVMAGLLAPRSGTQTRELVRERGLELKDRAEDSMLRAQTIANETLARVQLGARKRTPPDLSEPDITV